MAPPFRFDTIVHVVVGEKTFDIHKGVICHYSGYFNAAFNGRFIEADTKTVTLPAEYIDVFATVQGWIYTGYLTLSRNDTTVHMTDLCALWIFGDAHTMPVLQNYVADIIMDKAFSKREITFDHLSRVYEQTSPGAPLRRLLIDLLTKMGEDCFQVRNGKIWCKEAAVALLQALRTLRAYRPSSHLGFSEPTARKWDRCRYHVHEEGVRCPKKDLNGMDGHSRNGDGADHVRDDAALEDAYEAICLEIEQMLGCQRDLLLRAEAAEAIARDRSSLLRKAAS